MAYVNRTDETLILDKAIGKAWYGVKVARNRGDLEAGKYEYNPNIDWLFSNKDKLPTRPRSNSPGPDFAILAPGQGFTSEIDTAVVAQYDNPRNFAGAIRSGIHVFQMELTAWNHPGEASTFEESWQKFGHLVSGEIETEPIEIQVASNPKVKKKCKIP
jgi:hypothetical protein